MGKQFKAAAASAKPVYSSIIGSAQQDTPPQAVQLEQGTQGRKGQKQQRINMAFTPDNLDYLRVMSGIKGQSITAFVNDLIAQDRAKNSEQYKTAKQLTGTL